MQGGYWFISDPEIEICFRVASLLNELFMVSLLDQLEDIAL
jgi:hypothetical protein